MAKPYFSILSMPDEQALVIEHFLFQYLFLLVFFSIFCLFIKFLFFFTVLTKVLCMDIGCDLYNIVLFKKNTFQIYSHLFYRFCFMIFYT